MPVVAVFIEFFTAFSNGNVVIVTAGCPYIKKVGSSFTGSYAFAVYAFLSFFVVFVRHN